MILWSLEVVFGVVVVNFALFENREKYDFPQLKNVFGIIWNSSGLILWLPWSSFHDFHQTWCQNGAKINLGWTVPVVPEKNHERHRISHSLKPFVSFDFCFWSPF